VNATLLQRQAALLGVALLAAVGALALGRDDSRATATTGVVAPATTWRIASVGVSRGGQEAQCGRPVDVSTRGVVHPVLPCGVKLVVQARGRTIRTEVVGRGPVGRRHEFDLTPELAARLGLRSSARVKWRFAG
jgi:hypothetical protein